MIKLKCVPCNSTFQNSGSGLICSQCKRIVKQEDGVFGLANSDDYYYNIISKSDMREFLRAAKETSWDRAFFEMQRGLGRKASSVFHNVFDLNRAGWKFALPIGNQAKVLDLGAGWGSISLAFAAHCKHVVSLDLTKERLLALRQLADYRGFDNLTLVHAGDTLQLPFEDQQFDIVVVNGVLEWIPENHPGDPHKIQLTVLEDIKRVLRPGGMVYVAIENRFAYTYVYSPEDHTGLMWGSLFPRFISNLYSHWRRGKPYRTYTYSLRGYRRMLRNAGYFSSRFYMPLPNYRYPEHFVGFDIPTQTSDFGRPPQSWRGRLKNSKGFGQLFSHSFAMLGYRDDHPATPFIDKLLDLLVDEGRMTKPVVSGFLIRTTQTLLVVDDDLSMQESVVIRLPHSSDDSKRVMANALALQKLAEIDLPEIASFAESSVIFPEHIAPAFVTQGTIDGIYYSVESRLPGSSVAQFDDEALELLVGFLIVLGQANVAASRRTDTDGLFPNLFEQMTDEVANSLMVQAQSKRLREMAASAQEFFATNPLQHIIAHGDFDSQNVLWDADSRQLTGVVDWDQMIENGLPGWDVLNIFGYRRQHVSGSSWGRSLKELQSGAWTPHESLLWGRYCNALGIVDSDALRRELITTTWIRGLWHSFHYNMRFLNYQWVETNVEPMLET